MTAQEYESFVSVAERFAKDGEYPLQTIRRVLLSGEFREVRYRDISPRGLVFLGELLGLEVTSAPRGMSRWQITFKEKGK
ncbi:MAG: hypothetical protein A2836_02675 [Candidatus Taylorbacteria bacterium RIFCSPHIGHO2_01_FULL_45_63]|uniref:Uncharacterized protein n=1 Tax=Candidatus Taylorbacteria bacterium RIFCSPHIGHO2_02_FULL_45_35 TaxID=1802311 RepID=A0A1G2MP86_9BACT|nr:MAG: hypothetical protein A2836_02675 [Candidatus Taylorbacteria bacterium RIFCSPHIGHO2_01_FULL_45_63]OHA25687.1 MAG: hypothetical protein A3D56_00750 [Candidatus Taylorbacteria bacterium RIFCSPHIGHO2_02_FULL_45_35]OHA33962.1 MAG: hypothetical protein A3A22_04105 [Candidatus Taylorbacteria bacterium RIFCSPLOWO2_01_FULL_45_34b]QBM02308.1 hypothetical protein [uncultured archaeon]